MVKMVKMGKHGGTFQGRGGRQGKEFLGKELKNGGGRHL